MNKKMLAAVLGTFAMGSLNLALAEEGKDAPKPAKSEKAKPAKAEKGKKDGKGGEKSCSGDKGCNGKK